MSSSGTCFKCNKAFSGLDLITVEPDGRKRHQAFCPTLCEGCGSHMHYTVRAWICKVCGGSKPNMKTVYLIGSLRSPYVPPVANAIREIGFDVFDDWYAAGPEADDYWQKYEQVHRGHTFAQALRGNPAYHVFDYDHKHLDRSHIGVLVMPAGKSGHLELGYLLGQGKPCYVYFDKEPERWDIMYRFCKEVFFDLPSLLAALKEEK